MTGYDVIGDVHGHVEQLEALLRQLGYRERDGAWRHDGRVAVFVGDLIDRRPDCQLATLRLVRRMCDAGSARIVLGNHEFNAVAYATVDPARWDYCRPHSQKNHDQHREFLDELGFDSPLHRSMLGWFRSIPLWLDLDGLRVVHACWSVADVEHLKVVLDHDHTLNDEAVIAGSTKGSRTYRAIENVLKGPEVDMAGYWYFDKGGIERHRARAAWWQPDAVTLREIAVIPDDTQVHDAEGRPVDALPSNVPDEPVPRYTDDVPVVFGHYWRTGEFALESATTVCVDFSAGRGGPLVAYRWDGEAELSVDKLVRC
jgi:hypothetical protein